MLSTPKILIFRHQFPSRKGDSGPHVFDFFCIIRAATLIHRLGHLFRSQFAAQNLPKILPTWPSPNFLEPQLPPKALLQVSLSGLHFGCHFFCRISRRLNRSFILVWAIPQNIGFRLEDLILNLSASKAPHPHRKTLLWIYFSNLREPRNGLR